MTAPNPIIVRCRHGTGHGPLDGRDARQDRDWPTRTSTDRRGPVWTLPKQPITFDTRIGTIDVAIPKLRSGSYFPDWLLERRKRAEAALVSVVATCYLLGVSTRRMDKLVQSLGITSLSKSQVSRMAADLDAQVAAFRTRPLHESGPFTFVAADALTMKVREQGRVVNAVVLVATGVNADGHREVLGVKVATSETRQAWNAFFADLEGRAIQAGPSGPGLVGQAGDAVYGVAVQPAAHGGGVVVQQAGDLGRGHARHGQHDHDQAGGGTPPAVQQVLDLGPGAVGDLGEHADRAHNGHDLAGCCGAFFNHQQLARPCRLRPWRPTRAGYAQNLCQPA